MTGGMDVAILGATGPAGRAVAARLAAAGLHVVLGSRAEERAIQARDEIKGRWPDRELPLDAADNAGAADAEIVIVATPWDAASSTAASVADKLRDKVVVSMANAVARVGDELQAVLPVRGSVAAEVQAAVPEAKVVAAFHHLPARQLGDLDQELAADVLVCSDHDRAVKVVSDLVRRVPGLRPLHAGRLSAAGPIEAFTAVLLSVNHRYRARASLHLTGVETD